MKLDINFDPSIESIINTCDPLAEWFSRNQESMAYLELTHANCLNFENSKASGDVRALSRMANAALSCLESSSFVSKEETATNAAIAIALVYEQEFSNLSDVAKIKYYIGVERLKKCQGTTRHL